MNSPFLVVWGIIIAIFVFVIRWIIKTAIKKMEANEEKRLMEQRARMQASQANAPQMNAPQNAPQNNGQNGK